MQKKQQLSKEEKEQHIELILNGYAKKIYKNSLIHKKIFSIKQVVINFVYGLFKGKKVKNTNKLFVDENLDVKSDEFSIFYYKYKSIIEKIRKNIYAQRDSFFKRVQVKKFISRLKSEEAVEFNLTEDDIKRIVAFLAQAKQIESKKEDLDFAFDFITLIFNIYKDKQK